MFEESLSIEVVKVNPDTETIVKDSKKNKETRIWLECGPVVLEKRTWETPVISVHVVSHDYKLDCGGRTFEEAIVNLYHLVKKHYGDYAK